MMRRSHRALGIGLWSETEGRALPLSSRILSDQRPAPRAQLLLHARGVTLVELVVSITIIAIAVSAVLGVLSLLAKGSADAMIRNQAVAIASAYLEEIRLKDFTSNGASASRALYDDIGDYNGLVDVGARDQFGNAIAGLTQYTITITVGAGVLGAVPAASVRRIDVNVQHPSGVNMTLSGYRTLL